MKPVRPTYYDLGWLCLFWFCTGVFNGEIHCVQELGCHWAQSNQLSHRFNKQLPKDVITPQCCFHRDSITPLRSSFPLQHWPQWTSEHQRAVEHWSTLQLAAPCKTPLLLKVVDVAHSQMCRRAVDFCMVHAGCRMCPVSNVWCICVLGHDLFFLVFRCAEASPSRPSSTTSY